MPLPNHFKILLSALTEELHLIRAQLYRSNEQIGAIRNAAEAANETQKEIPARLSELRVPPDVAAKADAYRHKTHRQQVFLTWGTWFAFIAATVYAGIAYKQKKVMDDTLGQVDQQTVAAQQSAQRALETLNEMKAQGGLLKQQTEGALGASMITESPRPIAFYTVPALLHVQGMYVYFANVGRVDALNVQATGTMTRQTIPRFKTIGKPVSAQMWREHVRPFGFDGTWDICESMKMHISDNYRETQ